jgi:hypothetical protein
MTISRMTISVFAVLLAIAPACSDNSPRECQRLGLASPTLHRALAYGDFDGNGSSDWAAGFAESESACPAGKVDVWYQTFNPGHPTETWRYGTSGADVDPCDASFGAALGIGDFNGDGYDDLAVGAPGDRVSSSANAGSVHVLYGSPRRLADTASEMLNQDSAGVPDTAEPNDAFGTALASGDFDCDGYADLAIGAPGESKATADVGAVHILYGGSDRLPGVRGQFVQHSLEQADDDAGNWYFGSFLAAGNINGDERGGNGCDDLVVGIPGHGGSSATGIDVAAAGAVAVLYGGDGGIDGMKRENWHQGLPGIPDDNEANDEFGRGVWLVDDNLDGYRDLLVYSHGDDAVFLIYGASAGLRSSGATKLGPEETEEGWLRDACMWGCKFARLAGAPVPICGCVACELLSLIPPEPCPNCG